MSERYTRDGRRLTIGEKLRQTEAKADASDVKALVRAVARLCWSDAFIDGGDLQELLVKYGCITLEVVNEPCGEDCVCAECGCDFPTKCYRITPEFKEEDSHD